jgi:hypothetical protein
MERDFALANPKAFGHVRDTQTQVIKFPLSLTQVAFDLIEFAVNSIHVNLP